MVLKAGPSPDWILVLQVGRLCMPKRHARTGVVHFGEAFTTSSASSADGIVASLHSAQKRLCVGSPPAGGQPSCELSDPPWQGSFITPSHISATYCSLSSCSSSEVDCRGLHSSAKVKLQRVESGISEEGLMVQASLVGPKGITPLHLAAMSKSSTAPACLIASYCGASQWTVCTTHDGLTPSDFAVMAGNAALDAQMKACISPGRPQFCPSVCQPIPGTSDTSDRHEKFALREQFGSPSNSSSSKDTAICVDFGRCGAVEAQVEWSDGSYSDSDSDCR